MEHRQTKWWKRLLIGAGRFLEIFFAFLFLYLTISIYGAVIPVGSLYNEGDITIYVQSNGVHTDVCLPVRTAQMNWLEFIPGDGLEYSVVAIPKGSHTLYTLLWAG